MFFDNLKNHYDKLSSSEQQVIDYLMKQENIENTTLKEIKQDTLFSSSTVIRACKKLGYNTFNELKYDLRSSKELEKNIKIQKISTLDNIKEQLSVEFERTISILDKDNLENFANKIISARRIFCVGSGSSYMVMSDFNRKLKLMNLWSNDYFEQFSIERIPEISTNKDVIIIFSLGGANKFINDSLLKAKQKGTTILTVTSLNTNPLTKLSDHTIKVYDAPKKREKIRSRLMLNLVATILFEMIVIELNKREFK